MQRDAEGLQQIMMQSRVLEAVSDNVTTLLTTHRSSSPGQAELSVAMPYIKSGDAGLPQGSEESWQHFCKCTKGATSLSCVCGGRPAYGSSHTTCPAVAHWYIAQNGAFQ